jgi:AraC-like DNA-binding protein
MSHANLLAHWGPQNPNETAIDDTVVDILDDGLAIGLSRYSGEADYVARQLGDNALKFHFQLTGSACFSIEGGPDLKVSDMTAVMALQGLGVTKTSLIDVRRPNFSVTIMCTPAFLQERLGVEANGLPTPIAKFLETGDANWFHEVGVMTPAMAMAVRSLESMRYEGLMRRTYLSARALELMCDLCSEIAPRAGSQPRNGGLDARTAAKAEQTRLFIDEHYARPLEARALARAAGTNEGKLSRAFRAAYGMTIFEYVRRRRMDEGRRLLRASDRSVTEIAFDVGYEYPCNVAVAFKRHFGVSPRQDRLQFIH